MARNFPGMSRARFSPSKSGGGVLLAGVKGSLREAPETTHSRMHFRIRDGGPSFANALSHSRMLPGIRECELSIQGARVDPPEWTPPGGPPPFANTPPRQKKRPGHRMGSRKAYPGWDPTSLPGSCRKPRAVLNPRVVKRFSPSQVYHNSHKVPFVSVQKGGFGGR